MELLFNLLRYRLTQLLMIYVACKLIQSQHGVNALAPNEQDGKGRISIILWGLAQDVIEEDGSPPLLGSDGKGPHAGGSGGRGGGKNRGRGHRNGGRGGRDGEKSAGVAEGGGR